MLSITAASFDCLASYFPMPSIPAGLSNVLHCSFMSVSYKLFSSPAGSGKSKVRWSCNALPSQSKGFSNTRRFCRSAAVYCSSSVAVRWFQPVVPLIQVSPRSLGTMNRKKRLHPRETRFFFRELSNKDAEFWKISPKPVVHVAS